MHFRFGSCTVYRCVNIVEEINWSFLRHRFCDIWRKVGVLVVWLTKIFSGISNKDSQNANTVIQDFSYCHNILPGKGNACSGSQFKYIVHQVQEIMVPGAWSSCLHCNQSRSTKQWCLCAELFHLYIQSKSPAHAMVLSVIKVCLSSLVDRIYIIPHRHRQGLFAWWF